MSNLPYLSKILERAVADQLQAHLDTNGLHVKFQSAYRRGHSTETALLRILNDLVVMSDGGNNALLVLLDLSAAFDTLDHTLLLQRLHAEIGLSDSALDWLSSYLSCRSQQVLALSADSHLLLGVSQGSVLGPLLFSPHTRQSAELIDMFCIDTHVLPTTPSCAHACQQWCLSNNYCQSLIAVMAFYWDCSKSRLNIYRQCKKCLQEL